MLRVCWNIRLSGIFLTDGGSMNFSSRYSSTTAMPRTSSHGMSCGSGVSGSGFSSLKSMNISGIPVFLPLRPSLCRKLDTVVGAPIFRIRSIRPMSMPSSNVTVAQATHFFSSFSFCSASSRIAAERFP